VWCGWMSHSLSARAPRPKPCPRQKEGASENRNVQTQKIHIYNEQEMSRLNGDSQGYARLFYKIKKDRATCMHYDVVLTLGGGQSQGLS